MKQKLTLTIEDEAVTKAKVYARKHGTSLSRIVETQFKNLSEPSFARSWRRRLKRIGPKVAGGDDRLRYLTKKYLKD